MGTWAAAAALAMGLAPAVQAQVIANQITFPQNIGRTLSVTVQVDYSRVGGGAAVINTTIPPELSVLPAALPSNCVLNGAPASPVVACTVPAGAVGDTGALSFPVRGQVLGGFNLTAQGPSGGVASNSGVVRQSGELTLVKTVAPSNVLISGQTTTFTLRPKLDPALGAETDADDLPSGAVLTITDRLPGTASDFTLTAISGGVAVCNTASAANSSRTVSCTITGPVSAAAINAAAITLTGTTGNPGNFINTAAIADQIPNYFDRDTSNNTASVAYTVNPGSDLAADGTFPSTPLLGGSTQTLTLRGTNNGPLNLPAGSTVDTTVPAGFTITSLPAACVLGSGSVGTVLSAPATVTCTAGALAVNGNQAFAIGLTLPVVTSNQSGSFTVTTTPPSGFGDAVSANNSRNLPYTLAPPYTDLRLQKTKSPGGGPVAPGTVLTTTLTIVNDAASPSAADYTAATGSNPLRVVDYLRPEEIAGDVLSGVTAGWQCSVSAVTDPSGTAGAAGRTRRVLCLAQNPGTLAPGASTSVSFATTVAALTGQATLVNRACTGETVLSELGLQPEDGPLPKGNGFSTANDCATAGGTLVATDVVSGQAAVTLRKESSADGSNWVDNPATPPLIDGNNNTARWRITLTTPAGLGQTTIPTLNLRDTLPGIFNVTNQAPPNPVYQTPAVALTVTGAPASSCAAMAAGSNQLSCDFTSVAPGSTIVVTATVQRPFAGVLQTNTATVSSPDAILSGTLSDSAALQVTPRVDLATTTKAVLPVSPRIGQRVTFTITTKNLGPDTIPAADWVLYDDLSTVATATRVGYGDFRVTDSVNSSCAFTTSAAAGEPAVAANTVRLRCIGTVDLPVYTTRSVQFTARILKPALGVLTLPTDGSPVYTGQTNTAVTLLPAGSCEFKSPLLGEVSGFSATCNDTASRSNNAQDATFNVPVPQIDLQMAKVRVLPVGQTQIGVGDPLRYRFRLQNSGESRAEGVVMVDTLTIPAGFSLANPTVENVNGVPAVSGSGFTLDTSKTGGTVSCTRPSATEVRCVLSTVAADNFLDPSSEVNFELVFVPTGSTTVPVTFANEARISADETTNFEPSNRLSNNIGAVSDTIFPRADLAITKTTALVAPATSVSVNQPVPFDLKVQNRGPQATPQMRVTDVLPANFEWVTGGSFSPALTLEAGVTAAPSSATGATVACTATPATLATAGSQQTLVCTINATPGPLGSGAFPGNSNADNSLTLRLWARPKAGLFTGPYGTALTNTASVAPGLDANGSPLSIDPVSGNNNSSSPVTVTQSSLAGRVFNDRNGNGVQDGTSAAADEGLGGVTVTLTGTDNFGNAISRSTTTVATSGATKGDYLFDDLPPGSYTVTETQPSGFVHSLGTPAAPSAGGSYAAAASASTSAYSAVTLPAATAATGYLFPESLPPTTVSGTVFLDRDRNGSQGGNEPGIAGVALGLYPAGTVCPASGALPAGALQGGTTSATGAWSFTSVTSGNSYVVCQAQPAGYADAAPQPNSGSGGSTPRTNQIDIANLPLGGSSGHAFPEVLGSISGAVFVDFAAASPAVANNGSRNTGEAGLGSATAGAGVAVTLSGTPSAGPGAGAPIAPVTVTTDADGQWRFDDLFPGNYTVTEAAVPPALGAFVDGRNTAGSVAGSTTGSAGAVGDNAIRAIALPAGGQSTGHTFAELPAGSIAGAVYADANNDGQRQPTEAGYPGVTLTLSGTDVFGRPVSATTTTDATGAWRFDNLPPGTYTVNEPGQPEGSVNGSPSAGSSGGVASNTGPGSSQISGITLGIGAASVNNLFGEVPTTAAIAGTVWLDANHNGLRDAGETGLPGVVLQLSGTDIAGNTISRTLGSDANGDYRFTSLPPGRYTVTEPTQPAGTLDGRTVAGTGGGAVTTPDSGAPSRIGDSATPLVLAAGQIATGNNFGEIPPAELSGRVYADNNNSGSVDNGEQGLPAVALVLTGTDDRGQPVSRSTTSGADGSWRFADLRPGSYTVTEPTQPAGTLNGITTPGPVSAGAAGFAPAAAPGTATPVSNPVSVIAGIVLAPGSVSPNNLFGEIGQSPDLRVAKTHAPARFTVGLAAGYTITVRNAGELATVGSYTVSDRLPAGLTLAATPSGTGWSCSGAVGASSFSCSTATVIAAGANGAAPIAVAVNVAASAQAASPVDNAVMVEGGGEIPVRGPSADERDRFATNPAGLPACDPAVLHNACRDRVVVQASASVSGTAWLELGPNKGQLDSGDTRLPGWIVQVLDASNTVIGNSTTASDGSWKISNLPASAALTVRYTDPVSKVVFGYPVNGDSAGGSGATCQAEAAIAQGVASSCTASDRNRDGQPHLSVVLAPGAELKQQSLPVDPSGVVYDSGSRQPLPGATVTLTPSGVCSGWDPASQVVGATLGGYAISGTSISMVTGDTGAYQFLLGPTTPARCSFDLTVAKDGYLSPSTLITPAPGPFAPAGGPADVVAVQPQAAPPTGPVGPATVYYTSVSVGSATPGIVNNHLPMDQALPGGISLSKTGDRAVAEVGDTVRYTITVALTSGALPRQTTVVDRLPAGFTYIKGTALVNGARIADPVGGLGPVLAFQLGAMPTSKQLVLQYRVRVGVGSQQGDGINRARAHACALPTSCVGADGRTPIAQSVATNEGQHRVRVTGGVFSDAACVAGKVFVDCNGNHVQDAEELGIPGVRLLLQDGTSLVSDSEGKYSVCGLPPKSHVLRVDPSTLPRGSRLGTSSNRNLGDAGSLWLDIKNGELHRADVVEASCSNTVLEQTKARRAQGEVRAPETERDGAPALRFDSKAHGLDTQRSPAQGTDGANQRVPQPRATPATTQSAIPPAAPAAPAEQHQPTPALPMNQPPPTGRPTGTAPQGGSDATR